MQARKNLRRIRKLREEKPWSDDNSRVVYVHDNPDAREVELVESAEVTVYKKINKNINRKEFYNA